MIHASQGWERRRVPVREELMHQERITYRMAWVRTAMPGVEERRGEPNLSSIYREVMKYLKEGKDPVKTKHLAEKAIEKLDKAGRTDLSARIKTKCIDEERKRDATGLVVGMALYGTGGC